MNSSPNPNWKPGDPISSPVDEMVSIDPTKQSAAAIYKLLIGGIVPRPIAFVSTVNKKGVTNLAPFSFFNGVSSSPPCLMFVITRKADDTDKDTLRNILETKQFVVNVSSEWFVEAMHHASASYPYGVSEFEKTGLTPIASVKIKPPRVKESPIHFECELHDTLKVGEGIGSATIVVGQIVYAHLMKEAYQNEKIDITKIKPISRLGGTSYGRVGGIFDIERPKI